MKKLKAHHRRAIKHGTRTLVLTVIFVATGAYALAVSGLIKPTAAPQLAPSKTVRYWLPNGTDQLGLQLVDAITQAGYSALAATSETNANLIIRTTSTSDARPIQYGSTGTPAKLGPSGTLIQAADQPHYYLSTKSSAGLSDQTLAQLSAKLETTLHTAPSNQWSLIALGDIIFGRTVYLQMQRLGMLYPFDKFANTLAAADLTLADLECSISDARAVVTSEGMTFVSPAQAAAGLRTAGIDAVNLANNHSYNGGSAGYLDTLAAMQNLGIGTFGGGKDAAAARTPLILTTHGVKIALLGYSSIVGSQRAGATTPGMNYISMAPWGPFSDPDVKQMEADIKSAKAQADLVFVYYHWGTEYTHTANDDQRAVAHRAIDAGADLILGTHPHWVQGVEWYKDKLITYSLGNFIFDQEWSTKTKQGTYLSATFDGTRLTKAELVPYQIEQYLQPRPVNTTTGQSILNDVFTHSWWPQ